MPTAFGNYTPGEYQNVVRRLADEKQKTRTMAERIAAHVVVTGETNTVMLRGAVERGLGAGAWEELLLDAVRLARINGNEVRGPYARL